MSGRNKSSIDSSKYIDPDFAHLDELNKNRNADPISEFEGLPDAHSENKFQTAHKTKMFTLRKQFHNIDQKMTKTQVSNQKLMNFISEKVEGKSEFLFYNFVEDTNIFTLRFMIFLLIEEIEIIIKNINGSTGMGPAMQMDAKLEKRNEVINYLLKEKMIFAKFIPKIISLIDTGKSLPNEINRKVLKTKPFPGKQEIIKDQDDMKADFNKFEGFKKFSEEYFTDTDQHNFLLSQKDLHDPLNNEYYKEIKNFKTTFEKNNKYDSILKDYEKLNKEIDMKNAQQEQLLERFQDLVDDFLLYSEEGVFKDKNPSDLQDRIKAKHSLDKPERKNSIKTSEHPPTEINVTPSRSQRKPTTTEGSKKKNSARTGAKNDYVSAEELNKEILDLKKKLDAVEIESQKNKSEARSDKNKIKPSSSANNLTKKDPKTSEKKKPPTRKNTKSAVKEPVDKTSKTSSEMQFTGTPKPDYLVDEIASSNNELDTSNLLKENDELQNIKQNTLQFDADFTLDANVSGPPPPTPPSGIKLNRDLDISGIPPPPPPENFDQDADLRFTMDDAGKNNTDNELKLTSDDGLGGQEVSTQKESLGFNLNNAPPPPPDNFDFDGGLNFNNAPPPPPGNFVQDADLRFTTNEGGPNKNDDGLKLTSDDQGQEISTQKESLAFDNKTAGFNAGGFDLNLEGDLSLNQNTTSGNDFAL